MADDAAARLLALLGGRWVTAAISAAAELGLADALDAPRSLDELAAAAGCHAPSLERLLRVLVGEGLLATERDGRYALTPVGAQLRTGALRDLAMFVGRPTWWAPWSALAHSVRTGEAAFEQVHGASLFEHLAEHPDEARFYDSAVDAFTRTEGAALADAFDFGAVRSVVDIGGGRGTLLLEVLRKHPHLRGVLFDRPHVVDEARGRLPANADAAGGDFFERVPGGADVYVVRHVVHNWDDDQATRILHNCAEAMSPGGRVLVVEGVVLPGDRQDATRLLDLEMLVLTGAGRERTQPEMRRLFRAAGLKLVKAGPLAGPTRLFEGIRATAG